MIGISAATMLLAKQTTEVELACRHLCAILKVELPIQATTATGPTIFSAA